MPEHSDHMPAADPTVDSRLCLLLLAILAAAYVLLFTPDINAIDGEAIAAVSASFVRHGIPDVTVIGGRDALLPFDKGRMGSTGLDGLLYAKKGLTPSLVLLPLAALSALLPGLPMRATVMLLNPLVTLATALLLYTIVRGLRFRPRTAFTVALIYGLACLPLHYVRTLYGEPLAALLLLAAVGSVTRSPQTGTRWLVLAGVCAGLLAGVNMVYLLALPLLSLYALVLHRSGGWRVLGALLVPALACLALFGLYNAARFGSFTHTGYALGSGEGFRTPLAVGLFGLTFSPFRGLAWFSPVLLLALPGGLLLWRRERLLTALLGVLCSGVLLTFSLWSSWEGGVVWGPRFLLPIVPLLTLLLAPLVEVAWTRRIWLAALLFMAALSLLVQIPGALYSIYPDYGRVFARYYRADQDAFVPETLRDPEASAIAGQAAQLLAGESPDLVWLREGGSAVQPIVALFLLAAGAAVWRWPSRPAQRGMGAALVLGLLAAAFDQNRLSVYSALHELESAFQPPGAVLALTAAFGEALLDLRAPQVYSTNAPTAPDDPLALPMTEAALSRSERLWLVTWFPAADPANWQERRLWDTAAFGGERTAAGHRAVLFRSGALPAADQPADALFGTIRLAHYGMAQADDGLLVTLEWSTEATPAADNTWFVHVLGADGAIVAQLDRAPLGGYAPTSTWAAGQTVTERLFFPGVQGMGLRLRVGWVNPATGDLLSASGAAVSESAFALLPPA